MLERMGGRKNDVTLVRKLKVGEGWDDGGGWDGGRRMGWW